LGILSTVLKSNLNEDNLHWKYTLF